ncbi:hypothetical protein M9H77_30244 [Catharanthus roseus]|uniref:Uncharacterized protein n=1 Tax=Catharanthus roseus TaxID=4058 RepID=A0ACB9ZZB2_CATRO|nr:hypothetical protein M9H77_30244 [Catharanthus roseus]
MEVKRKQEDYQSKLARDMHGFHHAGGNGLNAYGGNKHGNGNFIPRRHVGVGNFSSYTKSYGHTFYDDYGGYDRVNTTYIIMGIVLMIVMKSIIIVMVEKFCFESLYDEIVHGRKNGNGALFDILQDKCLGKFVENVGYVSSFLDTCMENHNDVVYLNKLMLFAFQGVVIEEQDFPCIVWEEHLCINFEN